MYHLSSCLAFASLLAAPVHTTPPAHHARPFDLILGKRQVGTNSPSTDNLTVDLGYVRYQGVTNSTTGLNTWLGLRYAAPPTGRNRWQPPKAPLVNREETLQADTLPQRCPQSTKPPFLQDFNSTGDEDCLFLSVYAPPNATNLPVFVWIHGGGYFLGEGNQDLSMLVNTNNKSFIGLAIQYRLGAFGFLASDEVNRYGAVNAGLLDIHFALQWVQSYVHLFGGNASQVTISGESAGGGAVMLQAMAFGGSLDNSLFQNIHAASPYLPQQYGYADFVPSQSYYAFAAAAGCQTMLPQNNFNDSIFQCLVGKDTKTLQKANYDISATGRYATGAFLPVTDGNFVQQLPSQQLLHKKLNGVNLLVGNNANEGPLLTPQNVVTEDDFVAFVRNKFPLFTDTDVDKLLSYYPVSRVSAELNIRTFATNGTTDPLTAQDVSTFATGTQQLANNLYAETTFVCPSYWMAEAFTGEGRKAYKYQYSVPGALHGADLSAYFGPPTPNQGEGFGRAVMTMLGNFVTTSDPSISAKIAASNNTETVTLAATKWPDFSVARPLQLNLNTTGGEEYSAFSFAPTAPNVTQTRDPGLKNDFQLVNAFEWEGGRGRRCDFWRSIASIVPE